MPTTHTVKQGEYLSKIALQYGYNSISRIWDDPANESLKKKRKSPQILLPGDKIVIPETEKKTEQCPAEKRHRFRFNGDKLVLRIAVQDGQGEPLANTECVLSIGFDEHQLTTDGDGKIEVPVSKDSESGELKIEGSETPLKIGHLDPVNEQSGQTGRFNNLGYDAGDPDEPDENLFKSAVEEFQCDHELKVDGICGPNTQAKLEEVFGC